MVKSYFLSDEDATVAFGAALANIVKNQIKQGIIVFLNGDLGAGKTTMTRGFVRGMGHNGAVKSPTYTLVEPYELPPWNIYHFDLYRLADPEELEFMGIRDYFSENSCSFIEWPEKGGSLLAKADLTINLAYKNEQREVSIHAESVLGEKVIAALAESYLGTEI